MILHIEDGSYNGIDTPISSYSYTYMTDSDEETEDDTFIDVTTQEILWNGWDDEYKVVSVFVKKFKYGRLIGTKKHIAIYNEAFDTYFIIPNKLAKKEDLL
jgi:hypothetical protein